MFGSEDFMKEYLVFDWGGTFLKYALMDETTTILEQGKVPATTKKDSLDIFMNVIDSIVQKYIHRIKGIAISAPGIIDSVHGIAEVVGAFPYLSGVNLKEYFENRYSIACSVENDAKCAALAEIWKGSLKDCESGAVVIIGTSIGGGLVLDGKLRRGKHFFAGEFSGTFADIYHPSEDESYFGSLGVRGLSRICAEHMQDDIRRNGEEIFALVEAQDPRALAALKEYTDLLAYEIFNLNLLLDLDMISIGGGISRQPALLDSLRKSIDSIQHIHPDMVQGTRLPLPSVTTCRFFNEANLIGALYHLLYE